MKAQNPLPSCTSKGSLTFFQPLHPRTALPAQTLDRTHSDHITCSGNDIKANKGVETCRCSMKNPFKAKGHKPSRTQRAQAMVREGTRKKVGEVSSVTSSGLLLQYHKCWAPGLPSPGSISPGLFSLHHIPSSAPSTCKSWPRGPC